VREAGRESERERRARTHEVDDALHDVALPVARALELVEHLARALGEERLDDGVAHGVALPAQLAKLCAVALHALGEAHDRQRGAQREQAREERTVGPLRVGAARGRRDGQLRARSERAEVGVERRLGDERPGAVAALDRDGEALERRARDLEAQDAVLALIRLGGELGRKDAPDARCRHHAVPAQGSTEHLDAGDGARRDVDLEARRDGVRRGEKRRVARREALGHRVVQVGLRASEQEPVSAAFDVELEALWLAQDEQWERERDAPCPCRRA